MDSVSISFLINLNDVTDRSAIINKVNYNDATGLGYSVNVSSPSPNQRFNFGAIPKNFDCSSTNYDLSDIIDNGVNITANKWYHVVAIFTDSVQKIYINGSLASSFKQNFATLNRCSNNPYLLIGCWWSGDVISLHGSMDELRIYNRALNQDEITQLAKPVL